MPIYRQKECQKSSHASQGRQSAGHIDLVTSGSVTPKLKKDKKIKRKKDKKMKKYKKDKKSSHAVRALATDSQLDILTGSRQAVSRQS